MIIVALLGVLIFINLFTFFTFWMDKRRAIRQE
jgi:uncharacterized membrane protein YsdA (DUF1294 family)